MMNPISRYTPQELFDFIKGYASRKFWKELVNLFARENDKNINRKLEKIKVWEKS